MSEERLCPVCNLPMISGQAFNGKRGCHWACAPETRTAQPATVRPARPPVTKPAPIEQPRDVIDRHPARVPETGPTFKQMRLARLDPSARQIQSRPWLEIWRRAENGKTRIGLECPFCYTVIEAYVWSLPNGKRCTCGAMHGRLGSTHWQSDTAAIATIDQQE